MTRPIRTGRLRALPAVLPRIIALGAAVSFVGGPGGASADTTSTTASPPTTSAPCPSPNYPNAMTATGGTPQTAKTGASFQSPLQVQLINTNG
jgi:hypothetical protein